jgi:RNA polymerase sigma-70 factor (ECF subfamily)
VASIPDAWLVVPALAADEDAEANIVPRARAAPRAAQTPLVEQAIRGDEAALAALYAAHAPSVLRFLRDLLGDAAAAADATQETFVRAFRRLDTLRTPDRVAPWLFGIARNVAREHRKARRVRSRVVTASEREDEAPEPADGRTPEGELLGREAARVIEAALARLSDDRRAMLLLRLDHGLAYEDIAGLMGFSLAKVKVEIHRARHVLREELSFYLGGKK